MGRLGAKPTEAESPAMGDLCNFSIKIKRFRHDVLNWINKVQDLQCLFKYN